MTKNDSTSTRFRRPELERTAPHRAWSGVFNRSPTARAQYAVDSQPGANGMPPSAASHSNVQHGVQLGYRVIEDYLREGQNFAAGFVNTSPGSAQLQPQQLVQRMLQYASDLAGAWFDYVRVVSLPETGARELTSTAPQWARPHGPTGACVRPGSVIEGFDLPGAPRAPHVAHGAVASNEPRHVAPAVVSQPKVSVVMASARRVEVQVDLKPGPLPQALAAHDLRSQDPHASRIGDVILETDVEANKLTVHVTVPPAQAAGTYHGVVVDCDSQHLRGTISLRVFE